ncbi:hypothetical protein HAX54_048489 [Datura stramonium]|uniref:Uncharacterized protein n=1 Tax=Datura stramonium TaxID=4076 RepID=A0ABS8SU96_DATST|nr:hypothetical protein [Datura stramonium]
MEEEEYGNDDDKEEDKNEMADKFKKKAHRSKVCPVDVVRNYKLELPSSMTIRDFAGREFETKLKIWKNGYYYANPITKAQNEPKRKKVMKQVWQPKEANPNGEGVQGVISSIETKESPKAGVLDQKEVPWHVVKRHSFNMTPIRSVCVKTLPVKNGFSSLDNAEEMISSPPSAMGGLVQYPG